MGDSSIHRGMPYKLNIVEKGCCQAAFLKIRPELVESVVELCKSQGICEVSPFSFEDIHRNERRSGGEQQMVKSYLLCSKMKTKISSSRTQMGMIAGTLLQSWI